MKHRTITRISKLFGLAKASRATCRKKKRFRSLLLEGLEDRKLMAVLARVTWP